MNHLWTWFAIGFIFVIAFRILIHRCKDFEERPWVNAIAHILAIISIVLVGGISTGMWFGLILSCLDKITILNVFLVILIGGLIPAALVYMVGFGVLGLHHFDSDISHIAFILVFIISIVCFTIPITKYNRNIDVKTETVVSSTEERELLYFCNIPVQEISGTISGSSFAGTGNVSGNITTSNELSYWYKNKDGDGIYDSANANASKIKFLQEDGEPFVKIITYTTQDVRIDNNIGKETITPKSSYKKYEFHLPIEIMQYNLE